MVGKNNKQEQLRKDATKNTRFSLKKLSVGVASVAVGASLLVGNVAHAQDPANTPGPDGKLPNPANTVVQDGTGNGAGESIKPDANTALQAQAAEAPELQRLKDEVISDLLPLGAPNSLIEKIQHAKSMQLVQALADNFKESKAVNPTDSEADKSENLANAKELLNTKIDAVVKNSDKNKEFKAKVKNATHLEALEVIENEVDTFVDSVDAEELAEAKELLNIKIDAVVKNHDKNESFKAKVKNATDLEALEVIENEVDAFVDSVDAKELEEQKELLEIKIKAVVEDKNKQEEFLKELAELSKVLNLDIEDLQKFEDKVDAYVDAIDAAGEKDKGQAPNGKSGNKEQGSKADERLELARKAELERLSKAGLSKERTAELRKKFLAATSMEELARLGALVDKEATQDPTGGLPQNDGTRPAFSQKELDKLVAEERAKREAEIQKLPNLTQDQKDQLVAGLKKATTVNELDAILGKAKELNAAQSAKKADKKQEEKKEEKKQGERLPDTATGAWALGLVGASSILAGAGIKKFKK
ncbi:YSIRK-type signal peptide-containing protein [Dolosigranulum pigrum]|uniref:YSIRK-type signal peptide-containing protein n=1 Tax=Dolosigranulum pigrum TaxID=29394 RepID=UPI001AD88EA9|nr:YSIRK-type signal peptide-containing protein [Dolosigranulum pigrum]